MTNKEIAEQLIRGKRSYYRASDLRRATAIRVAGHRLGAVLSAKREKNGWRVVKSKARVARRTKPVRSAAKRKA